MDDTIYKYIVIDELFDWLYNILFIYFYWI